MAAILGALETPPAVVIYRADDARKCLMLLAVTSPIWLLWLPYVCWVLLKAIIQGGIVGYLDLVCLLGFFILLFSVCVGAVVVCLSRKIVLNNREIIFPFRFLRSDRLSCKRPWAALESVNFERWGEISTRPTDISLGFQDGTSFKIILEGLDRTGLRELFLSVEAHRPDLPWNPSFNKLEVDITGLGARLTHNSFTEIWEEELASKFTSTAYVPLEPGDTLQDGRITISGQANFGGLSAVYLAVDDRGQDVVVKEAVVPANANPEARAKAVEMFKRESELLAALDHQRIASVLDTFVEEGRNYMVLEHVTGKDLRAVVHETGRQPEDMVLRWAREVAEILAYLHGLDPPVIHRDLTPDNLLLAEDGSITIVDFGAANAFLGTATGTLVGKQSYISPEQFRGKAEPASDLYSLGASLHFLLTAHDPVPLSESSPASVEPEVSGDVDKLVTRLTSMEVEDRLESAEDLIKLLDGMLARRKLSVQS